MLKRRPGSERDNEWHYIPMYHNQALLDRAIKAIGAVKRYGAPILYSGVQKKVYRVRLGRKYYALKWHRCNEDKFSGKWDVYAEVAAFKHRLIPRSKVVPFLAWGWYAEEGAWAVLQPWSDKLCGHNDVDELHDWFNDMCAGNARYYRGTPRAIDYGMFTLPRTKPKHMVVTSAWWEWDESKPGMVGFRRYPKTIQEVQEEKLRLELAEQWRIAERRDVGHLLDQFLAASRLPW